VNKGHKLASKEEQWIHTSGKKLALTVEVRNFSNIGIANFFVHFPWETTEIVERESKICLLN
jgi:hypothetical protein